MTTLKKKQNIVLSLRDRELLWMPKTHFLNLNVISQRILNPNLSITYSCKTSTRQIVYDGGLLFFDNYSTCYSVYSDKRKFPLLFKFQVSKAKKRISDVVSYITPVSKIIDQCTCGLQKCTCLSKFLLSISEDSWLCQHNLNSGCIMREIYVGPNFRFKYCDWDMYGERITLTSSLNPYKNTLPGSKGEDVVANLAIFTVLPLEFYAVLQIKRSVFGKTCNHVNVSEELLILGIGTADVHIYSFPDVIKEGCMTSFKLGDVYERGKVGYYPTGLPLNCHVNSAPPLLFNVRCFGQEVRFGGFPFCYITCSVKDEFNFLVQTIDGRKTLKSAFRRSSIMNDDPNPVCFHPDNSNRIIYQNSQAVRCYKILNSDTSLELEEDFTLHSTVFPTFVKKRLYSSYGRSVVQKFHPHYVRHGRSVVQKFHFSNEKTVMSVYYEDELDIFAILFIYPNDFTCNGYIKLYDNFIGQELRTFNLYMKLDETNSYELHMDLSVIVVLEKVGTTFKVHIHQLGLHDDEETKHS